MWRVAVEDAFAMDARSVLEVERGASKLNLLNVSSSEEDDVMVDAGEVGVDVEVVGAGLFHG